MNITKINKKLEGNTHIRIMVKWNYYAGTCYAPKDGYLRDPYPVWENNKETFLVETFGTIESALEHINDMNLSTTYELDETNGEFVPIHGVSYLLKHGQYSAPEFFIRIFKN